MSDAEDLTRRGLLAGVGTAAGTAVAAGPAAAQENASKGGGGGTTHTVEMVSTSFNPSSITIAPGDTVKWENTSSLGHTVTAYGDKIPEGAAYFASGGFDSEQAARDAYTMNDPSTGYIPPEETFTHTFEVTGTYEYFCIPHEAAGMKGTVEVVEGGGKTEGGAPSPVNDSFKTIGVATGSSIVAVLVLAYAFLKYGGLDPAGRE
ncbi:MAG: plastocyanin/azurin family copper-binding protein [Halobacteriaceae archaeon]